MLIAKYVQQFLDQETPFYFYDLSYLRRTLQTCKDAATKHSFHVHYSLKANFNQRILATICQFGFGADCVSGNEVQAAVKQGFSKHSIIFAGVGKTDKEINTALDLGIFCLNVESIQEMQVINALAAAKNKIARVAIRINPNIDAHTHHSITTGLEENKFGINVQDLPIVAEALQTCPCLQFLGIHMHVGSQITDFRVFENLCTHINEIHRWFSERGFQVKILNVGGGLGVDHKYSDVTPIADFDGYFQIFQNLLEIKPYQKVYFELGRSLVAQCSALITRVLYVKNSTKKNFLIVDAGMTELIRPMLYQAYHKIQNISKSASEYAASEQIPYSVVGPICESTDCFGQNIFLPKSRRGDLLAIHTVGAYGEVMASAYTLRNTIKTFYSDVDEST